MNVKLYSLLRKLNVMHIELCYTERFPVKYNNIRSMHRPLCENVSCISYEPYDLYLSLQRYPSKVSGKALGCRSNNGFH